MPLLSCARSWMSFESVDSVTGSIKPSLFAASVALVQEAVDAGLIVLLRTWPGPVVQPITSFGPSWSTAWEVATNVTTPQTYGGRAAALTANLVPALASFLIVAQPTVWFAYSWWYSSFDGVMPCVTPGTCSTPAGWYPELSRPLGAPLGNYTKQGWVYSRDFEYAHIEFIADNITASTITWLSPSASESVTPSQTLSQSQTASQSQSSSTATATPATQTASPGQLASASLAPSQDFTSSQTQAASFSLAQQSRSSSFPVSSSPSFYPSSIGLLQSASSIGPGGGPASTNDSDARSLSYEALIAAITVPILVAVCGAAGATLLVWRACRGQPVSVEAWRQASARKPQKANTETVILTAESSPENTSFSLNADASGFGFSSPISRTQREA